MGEGLSTVPALLQSMRELGAALADHGVDAAGFERPITSEALSELETRHGAIPSDYRQFLLLTGRVTALDIHVGYDLFGAARAFSLLEQADGPPARLIDGTNSALLLPVGGDGGGNLFLLELREGGRVFKWNHERTSDARSVEASHASLSLVADSWASFLDRLVEDWRHFVAGDPHWRYLVG